MNEMQMLELKGNTNLIQHVMLESCSKRGTLNKDKLNLETYWNWNWNRWLKNVRILQIQTKYPYLVQ